MADQYIINSDTLTEIGNAIRGKDGTSEPIPVAEMASRIAAIETEQTAGYTNVLDLDTTIFKQNQYWSPSAAAWTSINYARSVVFQVPSGSVEIRIRGPHSFATHGQAAGSQILLSNDTESGWVAVDRWYNLCTVDEYGDPVITVDNSAGYTYCVIVLGCSDLYTSGMFSHQIMTINEPIG